MKAVSIITACKNRELSLESLMTWMQFKEVAEIIIVDWSSDKSLNYLTEWDKGLKSSVSQIKSILINLNHSICCKCCIITKDLEIGQ